MLRSTALLALLVYSGALACQAICVCQNEHSGQHQTGAVADGVATHAHSTGDRVADRPPAEHDHPDSSTELDCGMTACGAVVAPLGSIAAASAPPPWFGVGATAPGDLWAESLTLEPPPPRFT